MGEKFIFFSLFFSTPRRYLLVMVMMYCVPLTLCDWMRIHIPNDEKEQCDRVRKKSSFLAFWQYSKKGDDDQRFALTTVEHKHSHAHSHTCRRCCKTRNKRENMKWQQLFLGGVSNVCLRLQNRVTVENTAWCHVRHRQSHCQCSLHIMREIETVCMCLLFERFAAILSFCVCVCCVTAAVAIFISFHKDGIFLSFSLFDAASFAHLPDCCCCCCQNDDFIELIALTHGLSALATAHVHVLVYPSLSLCVWCWYTTWNVKTKYKNT